MEPLPRGLGRFSGLALAACAAIGLYLGAGKSLSEGTSGGSRAGAGLDSVVSAKAIAPPPPPTFDEAAIRRIAKDEAQALIAKTSIAASSSSSNAPGTLRKRATPSSRRAFTTPSDAGLVYARPPGATDGATAPASPAAPPSPPPGQVEQF